MLLVKIFNNEELFYVVERILLANEMYSKQYLKIVHKFKLKMFLKYIWNRCIRLSVHQSIDLSIFKMALV